MREVVVCNAGKVWLEVDYDLGIGARYKGATATIITDNGYASVYINDQLVRHLKIDPTRRYQPQANTPTGRRVASSTVRDLSRDMESPCPATNTQQSS